MKEKGLAELIRPQTPHDDEEEDELYVRSCYKRNNTSLDHAAVKGLNRVDEVGMTPKMADITVDHPMKSALQAEQAPKKTSRTDRHGTTWSRGMVTSKTGAATTKRRPWSAEAGGQKTAP